MTHEKRIEAKCPVYVIHGKDEGKRRWWHRQMRIVWELFQKRFKRKHVVI